MSNLATKIQTAEILAASNVLPLAADFSVGGVQRPIHLPIAFAAAAKNLVIDPLSSYVIDVIGMNIFSSGTQDITFWAGNRKLSGTLTAVPPTGLSLPTVGQDVEPHFTLNPGEGFYIETSAADPVGGWLKYRIRQATT